MLKRRRGATLAELVVAMTLATIVFALIARSVTAQRRTERAQVARGQSVSVVDEAVGVLTEVLSRLSNVDTVRLRGDTAIELDMTLGVGLACVVGGDSVVVHDDGVSGWWESSPDSGDTADAMVIGQWVRLEIVEVRARIALSGPCAGAQHVLKIRPYPLADADFPLVRAGRRMRFMVYRGGDGAWWFGERTCSAAPPFACSAAQPIAGPLAGSRGLQFAIDTIGAQLRVTATASAGAVQRTAVVHVAR